MPRQKVIPKNKGKSQSKSGSKKPKSKSISDTFAAIKLAPSVANVKKSKAPSSTVVSLPKCTLRYALACSDPFHPGARGACVPIGSSPTMKVHAFSRFDVTIGTAGSATIYLTPSLASDLPSVAYTDSTFAGIVLSPWSAAGTIGLAGTPSALASQWLLATHNGPFTAGQLLGNTASEIGTAVPVSGKMVAVGLRVQYTGTTLNESGLYYCYSDPAHGSLSGLTKAKIGSFGDVNIEGVSRKPCMLTLHAVAEDEMDFSATQGSKGVDAWTRELYPYSCGDYTWDNTYAGNSTYKATWLPGSTSNWTVPIGAPPGAVFITGIAGQSVHVEVIYHMEYVGLGAATMLTDTTPDVQGAMKVRTAAASLPQAKLANPEASPWTLMAAALKRVAVASVPYVVPIAEAALTALLV